MDLFSGCGGLAEGLRQSAGPDRSVYQCVGAIDSWRPACESFEANHNIPTICAGVSGDVVSDLLAEVGDIDVLVGGPPCQGFSTSGKRALDDPRNQLIREFLRAVEIANPAGFLMENVVGFTTFQGGRLLAETIDFAHALGYSTAPGIVCASLVGVPQRRRRFFLIGLRTGQFVFPGQNQNAVQSRNSGLFEEFIHSSELNVNQYPEDGAEAWSFADATSDLPLIEAGESASRYRLPPQNRFQEYCRLGCGATLTEHIAGKHRATFVQMMSYIPQGKSALHPDIFESIPESLRPTSGFSNSYMRITADQAAPTITRNFTTPSSANCIHPLVNRALTLREGARCQSFRDRYIFRGSFGDKRLQIGNAVPPLLGKAMGDALLTALAGNAS